MNSVGQTGGLPPIGSPSKKHQGQEKDGQKPIAAATHGRRDRRRRFSDKDLEC